MMDCFCSSSTSANVRACSRLSYYSLRDAVSGSVFWMSSSSAMHATRPLVVEVGAGIAAVGVGVGVDDSDSVGVEAGVGVGVGEGVGVATLAVDVGNTVAPLVGVLPGMVVGVSVGGGNKAGSSFSPQAARPAVRLGPGG
jgi:hypothetical protein